ncbi:NUDIX hydrolase [Kineothrix sp. MB12-C1]|uniref:NUDIX hydrolase n=1 Tax=Kineothrix sp. MB12-C1 TaxID=3070215 RepID=UPI0027D1E9EA|nr:8-oxo-dGTP diphosphatase [Kineothrix sp. MB12-C1]WMC92926.1 8-oxo-dGTP diphosphatase [Kineothrix sp. MB12-C1]
MTLTTLCYIEKDNSYLMLHRVKKEHDINKDKWIGIGGHFEPGESPDDCVIREAKEETGLTLTSYRLRGILTFLCDDITDYYIFLYTADGFTGDLKPCNEGTLEWVSKSDIPFLDLWKGDLIFFKLLEENAPFFSLKVRYIDNVLIEAVLNGKEIEIASL